MDKGFITLHRQFLEWEWYTDTKTKTLFIHCLLKANHTNKTWRGQEIKRGQFITSLQNLALETGLSVKEVRTCLKKLEKTGELGKQSTKLNTLITVTCYDKYQTKNKQEAKQGQSRGKQRATTNNDNNDNNENKFSFKKSLIDLGIDESIVNDYMTVRKNKKASNTQTAFKSIASTINSMKDQLTPNEIIKVCVENSWKGLNKEWFINSGLYKDATPKQKPISERMNHSTYYSNWMIKHGIKDPTAMTREQKQEMFDNYTKNVEI